MAKNPKFKSSIANSLLDTLTAELNGGFIDIYDGAQPAGVSTAITTQVKLASLPLNATAFAAASGGVATANAITNDSDADATGTATWFRAYKSDHTTAIIDGTVGTSSADLVVNSVSFVIHTIISISSFTLTIPV